MPLMSSVERTAPELAESNRSMDAVGLFPPPLLLTLASPSLMLTLTMNQSSELEIRQNDEGQKEINRGSSDMTSSVLRALLISEHGIWHYGPKWESVNGQPEKLDHAMHAIDAIHREHPWRWWLIHSRQTHPGLRNPETETTTEIESVNKADFLLPVVVVVVVVLELVIIMPSAWTGGGSSSSPASVSATSGSSSSSVIGLIGQALTANSEWAEKDDFLDVIYWARQILGVLLGLVFGLLGPSSSVSMGSGIMAQNGNLRMASLKSWTMQCMPSMPSTENTPGVGGELGPAPRVPHWG
ncbi:hypothetical protein TCAL_17065 [Tigriopus californicus]|uniref:Uncharacterized protein n=1 Tax=Tigriopus californicus TaxID=6832 RepID=A0A553PNL5_TIGCA|nr:hypothetical protein TCAL_17065 [Tigriopus californicus]